MDPVTLETLGSFDMPNAPRPQGTPLYQDFAGGFDDDSVTSELPSGPGRR